MFKGHTNLEEGGYWPIVLNRQATSSVTVFNMKLNNTAINGSTTITPSGTVYASSISRDGNMVALLTNTSVYLYRRSGTSFTILSSSAHSLSTTAMSIKFSPNGKWLLVCSSSAGASQILSYKIKDNGVNIQLSYTATTSLTIQCLAWAPDSTFFAVTSTATGNNGVFVGYVNTSGIIILPSSPTMSITTPTSVVWAPHTTYQVCLLVGSTSSSNYLTSMTCSTLPGNGFQDNSTNGYSSTSPYSPGTVASYFMNPGGQIYGMAVSGNGTIMMVGSTSGKIYVILRSLSDISSMTIVNTYTIGTITYYHIACNSDGSQWYAMSTSSSDEMFRINPITGAAVNTTQIYNPIAGTTTFPNNNAAWSGW